MSAGWFATYAHDPLLLRGANGRVLDGGELLSHQLGMEVTASLGLIDRLEIGVALPFIAYQVGDNRVAALPGGIATAALGDLRLELKILAIDFHRSAAQRIGLAAIAGVTAPTGGTRAFATEGGFTARPRLVFEWRTVRTALALNFGAVFRSTRRFDDLFITNQLNYGVAARVELGAGIGLLAELSGLVGIELVRVAGALTASESPLEVHAGFHIRRGPIELSLAGGAGLTRGYGTPDGRALLGLRYLSKERPVVAWGQQDFDRDGVANRDDRCPAESGPPENGGCPDRDQDGDGVVDRIDHCPDAPGPIANLGCPDVDSALDGVVDRLDRCPRLPGPLSERGCPIRDRDGDGVPDGSDRCPDHYGTVANSGCPDVDSDGDGIVDRLDRCPTQPEIFNGVDDDDGCPDVGPALAQLAGDRILLLQPIQFLASTPVLDTRSRRVLAAAGKILSLHLEIAKVRIEAHTDNHGGAIENLDLSRARAAIVRQLLIDVAHIAPTRLVAQGFGGDRPIADNRDAAGRAKNRRIELVIVERH